MSFERVGIRPARILLPAPSVPCETWACIACDQYTSEPEYWNQAYAAVGNAPSALRLILPEVLLPATTALGTIHPRGREMGIQAGANVVMPNLSPVGVRKKYELYDNKICTGEESAQCRGCLEERMRSVGSYLAVDRGDAPAWKRQ